MSNEETYSTSETVNGVSHEAYYFESWVGYSHPVELVDPLHYEEAQDKGAYYQALYRQMEGEKRLEHVRNVVLERTPIDPGEHELPREPGRYYYLPVVRDGAVAPGDMVPPVDTAPLRRYVRAIVGEGAPPSIELVERREEYSFDYAYDEAGVPRRVTVTNELGRKDYEI